MHRDLMTTSVPKTNHQNHDQVAMFLRLHRLSMDETIYNVPWWATEKQKNRQKKFFFVLETNIFDNGKRVEARKFYFLFFKWFKNSWQIIIFYCGKYFWFKEKRKSSEFGESKIETNVVSALSHQFLLQYTSLHFNMNLFSFVFLFFPLVQVGWTSHKIISRTRVLNAFGFAHFTTTNFLFFIHWKGKYNIKYMHLTKCTAAHNCNNDLSVCFIFFCSQLNILLRMHLF